MHVIGGYRFTETDARRTIARFPSLWEGLLDGRDPAVLEPLRPQLADDVGTSLRQVWEALLAAGPALRAAGQLPSRAEGTVVSVHRSGGGVPKLPQPAVDVDLGGVVGDAQSHREHHGRPWQALCIWSLESIESLRDAGNPIFPGAAGENVTVAGLPWAAVRPGVRLRLGEVLCDVTDFTAPCSLNAHWFVGGDFSQMDAERGAPSRVYATVLEPGRIAPGDLAVLEPDVS